MSGSPPTEPDRDPEASTADRRSPAQIHDESVAALVESPDDPVRLAALADSIRRMGAGATARPILQRAIELHQPSTARWTSLRIQLARLCHHEGLIEESLELLDGLDRVASGKAKLQLLQVRTKNLVRARRFDEARLAVREVVSLGGTSFVAQSLMAEIEIGERDDERAAKRLEGLVARESLDRKNRATLAFHLGRLRDRAGDHDGAFEAATLANELLESPFDLDRFEAETEAILAWSTRERIASLPRGTDESERSLLIVGMPRSGTSLLEQIIAAHPEGGGAGERGEFRMFRSLLEHRTGRPYPDCLADATPSMLDEFATTYRAMEDANVPGSGRITNKALELDPLLPLVSRVVPGSKAIILSRNPLDNLLSIYMHEINPAFLPWSCSLEGLVAARRRFDRLRERWLEVLEIDLLPLDYEDLVDAPEARIQEVLEFAGLGFDRSSVDFHESDRTVMTPSWNQVNRPINRAAVDRWRNYERHLGPVLEAFPEASG